MEIEMNKIESDAYYNEVLAIISSYKNLVENPSSIRFGHNL